MVILQKHMVSKLEIQVEYEEKLIFCNDNLSMLNFLKETHYVIQVINKHTIIYQSHKRFFYATKLIFYNLFLINKNYHCCCCKFKVYCDTRVVELVK